MISKNKCFNNFFIIHQSFQSLLVLCIFGGFLIFVFLRVESLPNPVAMPKLPTILTKRPPVATIEKKENDEITIFLCMVWWFLNFFGDDLLVESLPTAKQALPTIIQKI